MSDAVDEVGFEGRQLLNKSKTDPLRKRMRQFLDEQREQDLKQLRGSVSKGQDLSEIVTENRDERL